MAVSPPALSDPGAEPVGGEDGVKVLIDEVILVPERVLQRAFTLRDAIELEGPRLVGPAIWERYRRWPVYSKFFDNLGPIPHHMHQNNAQAALVGQQGKPESYYFPPQLNAVGNSFPYTFFGLEPGTTKNAEGRWLPYELLPELATVIDEQWTAHERLRKAGVICPWVFHREGTPITAFRKAWHAACTTAGVPGKIPHDFRRTAVRNLVRAGVPDSIAMKITGHKMRSVFDRYDIVNEADLRDAVGKLAALGTGTKMGQSRGSGRVARFRGSRK